MLSILYLCGVTCIAKKNRKYKTIKFLCCVRRDYFCIVTETQYKGGLSWDNSRVLEGVVSRHWFGMILEAPGLSATHQQSVNGSNAKLITGKTCVWAKIKEKEQVSNMHNGPFALKSEVM